MYCSPMLGPHVMTSGPRATAEKKELMANWRREEDGSVKKVMRKML